MLKRRLFAIIIVLIGAVLGYGLFRSEMPNPPHFLTKHPFHLGLDLSGGSHLLYQADISQVTPAEIGDSMDSLRDVIERRVNAFGVAEPVVQVETGSSNGTIGGTKQYRLSVELPGVTDLSKAIAMIGQTPFLQFSTQSETPSQATVGKDGHVSIGVDQGFTPTQLTGKYLQRAVVQFDPQTGQPQVSLQFNSEGAKMFEDITRANVGKVVAIYLDGQIVSAPVVREAITGGTAQISGNFTPDEAKQLVQRLNSGALPVPISLVSTETVGATLGAQAIHAGIMAAVVGFILIGIFLIIWYRLPGFAAVVALALYVVITLVLYRLIPVTVSAAGIAGFIISIGIAVDANILIFERFREERANGRSIADAITVGFERAWLSIRDANIASLIISAILFMFGTALIKGFALTLGLGVIISLISAISITKLFLRALPHMEGSRIGRFLFSSGFHS